METVKLPIGIEDFGKLRREGFYYVDKTSFISNLLMNWAEVNLFTRPRRFGKTLTLSMLKAFFEVGADASLFDGLSVKEDAALCERYMGKYPVIFVSLKSVEGHDFSSAYDMLRVIIRNEVQRLRYIIEAPQISNDEKAPLVRILNESDVRSDMIIALKTLTHLLCEHHGEKVILLIDEYDVPLDKAHQYGYYDEMIAVIRGMFGSALKTNNSLYFAVLTGALRVSKESLFTGLNNFRVNSITSAQFSDAFGFTDAEVRKMLSYYGLIDHYETMRDWYDGYRIGDAEVYTPWDVINYIYDLRASRNAQPKPYWINTSGNAIIRQFADMADDDVRESLETLISGGYIEQRIKEELTYNELDKSIDNLWSVMFLTGYLTSDGEPSGNLYKLRLPNREVRAIFVEQIREWFAEKVFAESAETKSFLDAIQTGDAGKAQDSLHALMRSMISYFDAADREIFYQGLILGLLRRNAMWMIRSNQETGDGRCDIIIRNQERKLGYIIELKYSNDIDDLEKDAASGLRQIIDKHYADGFINGGIKDIKLFGIAFHKKWCSVVTESYDNITV